MTVESASHPGAALAAQHSTQMPVHQSPFSQVLGETAPALPEGLSGLSAGASFSSVELFSVPLVLTVTDRLDGHLIATLADATRGGVFLSLVRDFSDSATEFEALLLARLPGARIEFTMPLAADQVWPQRAPWDPQVPARLMIIAWAGEVGRAGGREQRLALIVGRASASPAELLGPEPSFPVFLVALDQPAPGALFDAQPDAGAVAEAVARWLRPPRFLLRQRGSQETLPGYTQVAALTDPPLLLYELGPSAESGTLMKGTSHVAPQRPAFRSGPRVPSSSPAIPASAATRPVRLENWSALSLDEGMRLLFQAERTPLEGESLQQFLMAVQRAYAEARLMVGSGAPSTAPRSPRVPDLPGQEELLHQPQGPLAARVTREESDLHPWRVTYTDRIREQIASMGIMRRLGDLRLRLQERPDLQHLKFHEPSDALPQDPSVLIEIPWLPGVMLSIKARLSGKGVNLFVVPSDRRAATKAAFESLMISGLRRPFTVQTGGIHGKYAHCVVPGPGARTGSRSVFFDYDQVDEIARVFVETLARLKDEGPPETTMRL